MNKIIVLGDSVSAGMRQNIKSAIKGKVTYVGMENNPSEYFFQQYKNIDFNKYDTIIIQFGIYDFILPYVNADYRKKNQYEAAYYMMEFIRSIKRDYPNKRIIVESIYPNVAGYKKIPALRGQVRNVNNCMDGLCSMKGIEFFDTQKLLSDGRGSYLEGLSDDGIHPNKKGYKIVSDALNEMIKADENEM